MYARCTVAPRARAACSASAASRTLYESFRSAAPNTSTAAPALVRHSSPRSRALPVSSIILRESGKEKVEQQD
jgi:hypothetical protein